MLERVIPFISRIGCAWHDGELQIFQEHFATRLIGQFIEEHWQLINASNTGRTIILSSHPLEKHTRWASFGCKYPRIGRVYGCVVGQQYTH